MEEYRIRSRNDLRREKTKLLRQINESGGNLKTEFKESFSLKRQTPSGAKIDLNKLVSYALIVYRGFVWTRRVRTFLSGGKKKRRRK